MPTTRKTVRDASTANVIASTINKGAYSARVQIDDAPNGSGYIFKVVTDMPRKNLNTLVKSYHESRGEK